MSVDEESGGRTTPSEISLSYFLGGGTVNPEPAGKPRSKTEKNLMGATAMML